MGAFADPATLLVGLGAAAVLLVAAAVWSSLWRLGRSRQRPSPNLPPGPRNWPLVGAIFSLPGTQLNHVAFTLLAERYGPITYLRMGTTPFLLISNAHYAEQVLKEQDAEFASRPYTAPGSVYEFSGVVLAPYGPTWRQGRRILNHHLFSSEMFHFFQGVLGEEVVEALREVYAAMQARKEVSFHDLLETFSTNLICRMSMSKRYLGQNADMSRQIQLFKASTAETVKLFTKVCVGDIIPALRSWDIGGIQKALRSLRKVQDTWLDAVLADREGKAREVPDTLDALIGLKEQGELSDISVRCLMLEIQVSGSGASATAIHWAMSELLRNPVLMDKAQAELDSVVGRARRVAESDLPNLPFLRAVVKETWRLHPPLPMGISHHNEAAAVVGGFTVPAKSTVLINAYAIGRDPESWPDRTLEFVPERFLSPRHSQVDGFGQDFELLPFSAGRRKCPGAQMANTTVHLALASFLHAFDWALPQGMRPEDVDMSEHAGIVFLRRTPCIAVPTACRLDPSVYALS